MDTSSIPNNHTTHNQIIDNWLEETDLAIGGLLSFRDVLMQWRRGRELDAVTFAKAEHMLRNAGLGLWMATRSAGYSELKAFIRQAIREDQEFLDSLTNDYPDLNGENDND